MPNTAHTAGTRLPLRPLPALVAALALAAWPLPLTAAPLDEFLTAMPGYEPMHGEAEIGLGVMNRTVDLLGVRKEHLDARGDSIGDYKDYHLRGGLALTRRLWVDAGLWKRSVKTPYDEGENVTWQAGAQYQATINSGWLPAVALRVSAWGDSADEVLKGSPTPFMGLATASKIRVVGPSDRQVQGDIIATWNLAETTAFSISFGMGKSEVEVDALYAELFNPGCEYLVQYSDKDIFNAPMQGISLTKVAGNNCQVQDFNGEVPGRKLPQGLYVNYDATYFQLGSMLQWYNEDWRLKLGYRYQIWDRGELDEAVKLYQHADRTPYESNHHLSGEVGYKVFDRAALFFRSQFMTNQFVGEVPFGYNLYSSHKFEKKYGFLTFGLTSGF